MNEPLEARYTEVLEREVYLRPGTSDHGTWVEVFERGFHVPPPEMPTPRMVLDLGANIGLTAAHYAAMWPEALVWMVEPNPENMALARRNAPRCPPLLCAVARDSGWYDLREEGLSADAYRLTQGGDEGMGARNVYAMDLPRLATILGGGGEVDFVKMDVEGAEWGILDPLWSNNAFLHERVRHLLVEFHDEPRDDPRIVARGIAALEVLGYDARDHDVHPQAVWAVAR